MFYILCSHLSPYYYQYALLYDSVENGGRAVWDEAQERWKIPDLKHDGGGQQLVERRMTNQSVHRPETEYARRRKLVDPNPRWHTEDIVDLDLVMPNRSTPNPGDPNTTSKIQG